MSKLWIGSQKGVLRFDECSWRRFGSEDGLSSPNVRYLDFTAGDTLWTLSPGRRRLVGWKTLPPRAPSSGCRRSSARLSLRTAKASSPACDTRSGGPATGDVSATWNVLVLPGIAGKTAPVSRYRFHRPHPPADFRTSEGPIVCFGAVPAVIPSIHVHSYSKNRRVKSLSLPAAVARHQAWKSDSAGMKRMSTYRSVSLCEAWSLDPRRATALGRERPFPCSSPCPSMAFPVIREEPKKE